MLINSSSSFLIISNIYFPLITIEPVLSIIRLSLWLITVWIVISLSEAVKTNLSLKSSNLIPDKIGIIFLEEIALEALVKPSNKTFLLIS